jgi:hypothetical protein
MVGAGRAVCRRLEQLPHLVGLPSLAWLPHWGGREGAERDGEGGREQMRRRRGAERREGGRDFPWGGEGAPKNLGSCLRDTNAVGFGSNIPHIRGENDQKESETKSHYRK